MSDIVAKKQKFNDLTDYDKEILRKEIAIKIKKWNLENKLPNTVFITEVSHKNNNGIQIYKFHYSIIPGLGLHIKKYDVTVEFKNGISTIILNQVPQNTTEEKESEHMINVLSKDPKRAYELFMFDYDY